MGPVAVIVIVCICIAVGFYLVLRTMQPRDRQGLSNQNLPHPPEWASYFSPADWAHFRGLVQRYFQQRGAPFQLDEGCVYTMRNGEQMTYGLSNLAQGCHQHKRADWWSLINYHFKMMDEGERDLEALNQKLADFDAVKDMLLVRIMAQEALPPDFPEKTVCQEDLPGTWSYLAIDLPTTVRSLGRDDAALWGKTDEELFDVALANLRRAAVPEVTLQPLEDGISCYTLSGDSFFIASNALVLEDYPQCIGRGGALVVVPHRHVLIAYPINDLTVVKTVPFFGMVATGMHNEGPGSITPKLFWFRDGHYLEIPYEMAEGKFQVSPPDEFVQMLGELPESQEA